MKMRMKRRTKFVRKSETQRKRMRIKRWRKNKTKRRMEF